MTTLKALWITRSGSLKNALSFASLILVAAVLAGCATNQPPATFEEPPKAPDAITLSEGDSVRITFPGTSNPDITQRIRRDGKIALPIGDVTAAGLTGAQLEKEVIRAYAPTLEAARNIKVIIEASSYPIWITGAVLHPGRVIADRPLTLLQAIMEAGGPDYTRANLKGVVVNRQTEGRMERFTINVQRILDGKANDDFVVKPNDIIRVPEKFAWF